MAYSNGFSKTEQSREQQLTTNPSHRPTRSAEQPFDVIAQAVQSIGYGVVQIIIQDGRIVQIDRTIKTRFV